MPQGALEQLKLMELLQISLTYRRRRAHSQKWAGQKQPTKHGELLKNKNSLVVETTEAGV